MCLPVKIILTKRDDKMRRQLATEYLTLYNAGKLRCLIKERL